MSDVDTWRRNEAEARQEMGKRACSDCGTVMDECDALCCSVCGLYFCVQCFGDSDSMCPTCKADYDTPDELDYAEAKRELLRDDTLTGEKWTK